MSFLDNLENNLKALESREDNSANVESQRRERERQRAAAQAVAPHAEELKRGAYTGELLKQTVRVGHEFRAKINVAWLGANLRLEARGRRLEFQPTPAGIDCVYFEEGVEARRQAMDPQIGPDVLLRQWLSEGSEKG